ncbi:MAG: polysulfide reductase NrfD [Ignavibacteriae bacterium]|nr:polysulfide reductase NrfD [Ignavibacteriota bacterium]
MLALFFTVRIQDLVARDALKYALEINYQSILFYGELILGVFVPFFMLIIKKVRESKVGLFYSAVLVLLGFIAHRINTAITSMERWPDRLYVPSWQELMITAGLVAFGFVAFSFMSRYFNVFGHVVEEHEQEHVEAKEQVALSPSLMGK